MANEYTICMIRTTVRRKILGYVRLHPAVTAALVGRALGFSAATTRYHLGLLERDGRIVANPTPRPKTRGRPTKLYRLSERERGDNLAGVTSALLDHVQALPGNGLRKAVLASMVDALVAQVGAIPAQPSGTAQLGLLVDRLNALHYEAGWEAGAHGPRILFGHCPYAAIIARHPEVCEMDARMLSGKLGAPVIQTAKMVADPLGQDHCIFALK